MQFNPLAFIELFVVLAFLLAWGVLELVGRRLDRRRRESAANEPPVEDGQFRSASPGRLDAPRQPADSQLDRDARR